MRYPASEKMEIIWLVQAMPRMRLEPHRLIFIDETSVTAMMTRRRGRSLRGARLGADALFGHWRTQTFIAGLRVDELAAPWVPDGPMNPCRFRGLHRHPACACL